MADMRGIREHMEVIGADGVHVGTVDRIEGDRIKLTTADSGEGRHEGHHHYLPLGLVAGIDLKPIDGSPGLRAYRAMENGFHDHGIMIRVSGDTLALSPPLIVSENQIDEIFTDKLPKVLASVA